jgi:hypothetical protein
MDTRQNTNAQTCTHILEYMNTGATDSGAHQNTNTHMHTTI